MVVIGWVIQSVGALIQEWSDEGRDRGSVIRLRRHACAEGHRPRDGRGSGGVDTRSQRGREVHADPLHQQDPVPHRGQGPPGRPRRRRVHPEGSGQARRLCPLFLIGHFPSDSGRHRPPRTAPPCGVEDHRRGPGGGVRGAGAPRHPGPGHALLQRAVRRAAPEGHAGQGARAEPGHPAARRAHLQPGHKAPAGDFAHAEGDLPFRGDTRGHDKPRPQHRRALL